MPKLPPAHGSPGPLVVVLAYDGLCLFEFGIATEIFGLPRPEMGAGWYRFAVAAVDDRAVHARGGLTIHVDGGLELLDEAALVVIPGWADEGRAPVPPVLIRALERAQERGSTLAAICGGIYVLAAAGLLSGRSATTHWRFAESFSASYPDVKLAADVLYVDEGNVLTSAGSAAGIDLCLHLVRRDYGAAAANSVARRLVMPAHREGDQAQFVERPVPPVREGARLGRLLDQMRAHLGESQPLSRLASASAMSVRTLLRRFRAATGMTPSEWLLVERLARARDLLEASDATIQDIATLCGFGSIATMRHHFRTRLRTSPAIYRARFKATADKAPFARSAPRGKARPSARPVR